LYKSRNSATPITSISGTHSAIHPKKLIWTPVAFRIKLTPMRFGGDPTLVPIPPMLAA
jgi:hypothetical protein